MTAATVAFVCVIAAVVVCATSVELLADRLSEHIVDENFCFVSFGCWGGLNRVTQKRVAKVMGGVVDKLPAKTLFVIAAGDNFYRKGVTGLKDERFLTTFDRVYTHESLMQLPFLVALGNHDYRGDFFAQVNYTQYQLEHEPRSTGRWYLPEAYYAKRVHRDMVVIVLDGPLMERCANNGDQSPRCWDRNHQKRFVEDQLEANKHVMWKVVVCHYPMHANGPHVNFPWLVTWLQPLLEKYCVDLYINADNHYLQASHVNGVWYVNSGGGAGFGVRHLASNKNYRVSPHSKFIRFEDGIFAHCVFGANRTIVSTAVNHEGESVYQFTSARGALCGSENIEIPSRLYERDMNAVSTRHNDRAHVPTHDEPRGMDVSESDSHPLEVQFVLVVLGLLAALLFRARGLVMRGVKSS